MNQARWYFVIAMMTVSSCGSPAKETVATSVTSRGAITPAAQAERSRVRAVEPEQPAPKSANKEHYTDDRSNRTGVAAIRPTLVMVGRFDDAPILAFKLESRCRTAFMTQAGTTVIDWAKVDNFAGHDEGDRFVIPFNDGNGEHVVSLPKVKQPEPVGNAVPLVKSGFGAIYFACKP